MHHPQLAQMTDDQADDAAAETVAAYEAKYNRLKARYREVQEGHREEVDALHDELAATHEKLRAAELAVQQLESCK
jgi:hypothetical protein